jgi:hypothetical protein
MRFRLSRCSCCTSCFSARTSFSRLASESATERLGRTDFFWLTVGASDPDSMAAGAAQVLLCSIGRGCQARAFHIRSITFFAAPRTLSLPLPRIHQNGREVIVHSLHASRLDPTFAELYPARPLQQQLCQWRPTACCPASAQKMELYSFSLKILKIGAAPLAWGPKAWPPPPQQRPRSSSAAHSKQSSSAAHS